MVMAPRLPRIAPIMAALSIGIGMAAGTQRVEAQAAAPLTIEQAIQIALKNNPSLQATAHQRNAAGYGVDQAKARRAFDITAYYTHTEQRPPVDFGGRTVTPPRTDVEAVTLSQPLFAPALTAGVRVSEAVAGVADYGYQNQRQQVIYDTTRLYLDVLRAEALLDVAAKSVASNQERQRVAQLMFQAGNSPRYDVLRAQVQLAAAQEQQAVAENGVALAKANFNSELGRAMDSPVSLAAVPRELAAVPTLADSLSAAYAHRPDLAGAHLQIEQARQQEAAARAGDQPSLSLVSTYSRQPPTTFAPESKYSAALVVNVPIFDSGLTKASVNAAREQETAAQHAAEQVKQQVDLDVQRALLNIQTARLRIDVNQQAVVQAEEALRIANLRYEGRMAPIVEVLDADSALTLARDNEVNAWFDYALAQAEWRRAVGEGQASPTPATVLPAAGKADAEPPKTNVRKP